ncbi:Imm30 family immunity protein [Paenibacillus marchantiophytorum]|uniref:Imm30 family immunity protein n=1 Tax=Paenibacillus marchantiophytorum TaxID=1619310 RepID=UPI001E3E43B9|nr:Imm30 family immunity protein [Paenibacillus marchantiophytorum]
MNQVDHLKNLCSGFDDATEHDDVMFGLIHAIESYDKTIGAETVIPDLGQHAAQGLAPSGQKCEI